MKSIGQPCLHILNFDHGPRWRCSDAPGREVHAKLCLGSSMMLGDDPERLILQQALGGQGSEYLPARKRQYIDMDISFDVCLTNQKALGCDSSLLIIGHGLEPHGASLYYLLCALILLTSVIVVALSNGRRAPILCTRVLIGRIHRVQIFLMI